jgi:hypothetical protein
MAAKTRHWTGSKAIQSHPQSDTFHMELTPLVFPRLSPGRGVQHSPPQAFAADSVQLFRNSGQAKGNALRPGSAEHTKARLEGRALDGRVKRVEKDSFRALARKFFWKRIIVQLPLVDGSNGGGSQLSKSSMGGGFLRVAGSLSGKDGGSFFLSMNAKEVGGLIQLPKRGLAYRVEQAAAEEFVLREVLREDVICTPMPKTRDAAPRARSSRAGTADTQQPAPSDRRSLHGFRRRGRTRSSVEITAVTINAAPDPIN